MTPYLALALEAEEPPFHGVTYEARGLDLEGLLGIYRAVMPVLLAATDSYLWECADWHWHDGYLTRWEPLERAEWEGWLESPETLTTAWRTEDYVHRGVYPQDMSWYVRFHLWERNESGEGNGFDVSGSPELIRELFPEGPVEPSGAWFLRNGCLPGNQLQSFLSHMEREGQPLKPHATR